MSINYFFILVKIKLNAFFLVGMKICLILITYNNSNNRIKYSHIAEYHVCCFEANLHEEFMVMKSLWKTSLNLQFLYRQNQFLNPKLCGLLSNSLIQSHFDYASTSWYPLISQKLSRKI